MSSFVAKLMVKAFFSFRFSVVLCDERLKQMCFGPHWPPHAAIITSGFSFSSHVAIIMAGSGVITALSLKFLRPSTAFTSTFSLAGFSFTFASVFCSFDPQAVSSTPVSTRAEIFFIVFISLLFY